MTYLPCTFLFLFYFLYFPVEFVRDSRFGCGGMVHIQMRLLFSGTTEETKLQLLASSCVLHLCHSILRRLHNISGKWSKKKLAALQRLMMVRTPSSDKNGLKKGTWTPEEDQKLVDYITRYGHWNWRLLPKFAGNIATKFTL